MVDAMRALDKRLAALEGHGGRSAWSDILDTLTDAQIDRLTAFLPTLTETTAVDVVATEDLRLLAALRLPSFVPDVAREAQSLLMERADA